MHPETLVFGVVPAIFLLSILIAFCKAKAYWRALGTTLWLFPVLLVIGLLVVFGYCEANKAYWDYKVRNWCEKDGGVTVYKKVELSKRDYENHSGVSGGIVVPPKSASNADKFKYFSKYGKSYIKKNTPEVYKQETIIFRGYDNMILGKLVRYSRTGGDFPTVISHPTGSHCPESGSLRPLLDKIFSIKGAK